MARENEEIYKNLNTTKYIKLICSIKIMMKLNTSY